MDQLNIQRPSWAWFVLIFGGLFSLIAFPGILMLLLIPIWKPDDFNSITIILDIIGLCVIITTAWGMKKAFYAIRAYNLLKTKMPHASIESNPTELLIKNPNKSRGPIWAWIVIGTAVLPLVYMGPGVVMLPIMPLYVAIMSTDSGSTSAFFPILTIGYGILICYGFLLTAAIYKLRNKK